MPEYGDMYVTNVPEWSSTVLMVVNSEIDCEHCGRTIVDWSLGEDGRLLCPFCGEEIREFRRHPCGCGEDDLVTLSVAANNNFGSDLNGGVTPYNEKLNRIVTDCAKALEKQVREGRIHKCSRSEAVDIKRRIVWTSSDEYEPGTDYPQWVKDMIPDE